MAFESVDTDSSESLDKAELGRILKQVAKSQRIKQPTDNDVGALLQALDADQSEGVEKKEFTHMITLVLKKMAESEQELQTEVNKQVEGGISRQNTEELKK